MLASAGTPDVHAEPAAAFSPNTVTDTVTVAKLPLFIKTVDVGVFVPVFNRLNVSVVVGASGASDDRNEATGRIGVLAFVGVGDDRAGVSTSSSSAKGSISSLDGGPFFVCPARA